MSGNPYQNSAEVIVTQPSRGRGLARRLVWFAIGFIVSWIIWSAIYAVRARPQDITQTMPQELRDMVSPDEEWMKNAIVRKLGGFVIVVAADPKNASAAISPRPRSSFPNVMLCDDEADGRVDTIIVTDASWRGIFIDVADDQFQSFTCDTKLGEDSVMYKDGNMDGEYDYRFVPGKSSMIMVNGAWREYVQEGDTRYVDLDGRRTALKLIDGVWRITDDE
jgi:hypothetical protein